MKWTQHFAAGDRKRVSVAPALWSEASDTMCTHSALRSDMGPHACTCRRESAWSFYRWMRVLRIYPGEVAGLEAATTFKVEESTEARDAKWLDEDRERHCDKAAGETPCPDLLSFLPSLHK